jgi:hypothetical protein
LTAVAPIATIADEAVIDGKDDVLKRRPARVRQRAETGGRPPLAEPTGTCGNGWRISSGGMTASARTTGTGSSGSRSYRSSSRPLSSRCPVRERPLGSPDRWVLRSWCSRASIRTGSGTARRQRRSSMRSSCIWRMPARTATRPSRMLLLAERVEGLVSQEHAAWSSTQTDAGGGEALTRRACPAPRAREGQPAAILRHVRR